MSEEIAASEDPQISFKVKTSNDGNHSITMPETATVLDLKTKLASTAFEDIPADRQRLIYSGRVMKNEEKLSFYKIKEGNTVHMVKSAPSNAAQKPANAGASAGSSPAAGVPTNMAAGTAVNNPLVGLTGARYAGHNINLPGLGAFGADGGMGAPPTEEQMADLLSDPNTQQTMNEALNNPAMLDMIINSSPALRQMGPQARELLQSPFFRQMLTNPDMIRQQARMRSMMAGGRSSNAFPAPGVTDNTPGGTANNNANTDRAAGGAADTAANANLLRMFGGESAANPFAALLNLQGRGQTPAQTPPPPGSAGQASPGSGDATQNSPWASSFFGEAPPGAGGGGLASMMTPEAMQAAMQMMQDPQFASMMGLGGAGAAGGASAAGDAGAGAGGAGQLPTMSPEMIQQAMQMFGGGAGGGNFGNMFGGMGAGGTPAPADTRPPEEIYAEQLRQLNDMGFFEFDRNVAALRRSGGSVQGAIEQLLNGS